jgi:hypothetical protein
MLANELKTMTQGLILIAVMLAVIAAGVWVRPGSLEPTARAAAPATATTDRSAAGIPDAGLQRQTMIEELKKLNERLSAIEDGLKEGRFVVQTMPAEKTSSAKAP